MAFVVAVYLEKGGSRKTTSTVHLAHAFGARGFKTLVLDVDAQRHASKWLSNEGPEPALSILDVVKNPDLLPAAIVPSRIENVDLIMGSRILPMIAESVLRVGEDGTMRNPTSVLRLALKNVPPQYQLVLIDCSPSVSPLNSNALAAADLVVSPLDMADMSFEGLRDVAMTLTQMVRNDLIATVPPISVLLSTSSKTSKTTREIRDRILGVDGAVRPYHVFSTMVRERDQMRDIYHRRQDAFDLSKGGGIKWMHLKAVATDYDAIARELAALIVKKKTNEGAAIA